MAEARLSRHPLVPQDATRSNHASQTKSVPLINAASTAIWRERYTAHTVTRLSRFEASAGPGAVLGRDHDGEQLRSIARAASRSSSSERRDRGQCMSVQLWDGGEAPDAALRPLAAGDGGVQAGGGGYP